MAKAPKTAPWAPAPYDDATIGAIKALAKGEARPDQQIAGLKWIVESLCGYYDLSFRPGPDGERETCFAEGKRSVGSQIVKLTKMEVKDVRRSSDPGNPGRDPERA